MTAGKSKTKTSFELRSGCSGERERKQISGLSPHGRTRPHAEADGKTVTAQMGARRKIGGASEWRLVCGCGNTQTQAARRIRQRFRLWKRILVSSMHESKAANDTGRKERNE